MNPVIKHLIRNDREVLLFSKEVEVINLDTPEVLNKIAVLFDNGAQAKYSATGILKHRFLSKCELNKNDRSRYYTYVATVVDYLTNKIRVISVDQDNASDISTLFSLTEEIRSWKQPELIIEVDYFFKFISLEKAQTINSGFSLINTIVGPYWKWIHLLEVDT
uniref:Uncharacterized protein n=1 Tax=Wuchereria bancrofti TaxID=6293 RepID=A0AAF5PMX1_WUCBA